MSLRHDGGSAAGSAHRFELDDAGVWRQTLVLAGDGQRGDRFGASVGAWADTIVVGAPGFGGAPVPDVGAVYVITGEPTTGVRQVKLLAGDAIRSDELGTRLAVGASGVLAGTPSDRFRGEPTGSATFVSLPLPSTETTITIVQAELSGRQFATSFRFGGALGAFRLQPGEAETVTVEPGTHRVRQQQFSRWNLDRISCRSNAGAAVPVTIDLDTGVLRLSIRAGENVTCVYSNDRLAEINARVVDDLDGDGRLDRGEPFLAGSVMELFGANGDLVASEVTDDHGRARFLVARGEYTICNVVDSDRSATSPQDDPAFGHPCAAVSVNRGDRVWRRLLSTVYSLTST